MSSGVTHGRHRIKRRDYLSAALLLLPTLLGLLLFRLYPVFEALVRSLESDSISHPVFVGLGNFRRLFADPSFWNSFWVTIKFTLLVNPIQIFLAICLALLLTRGRPGENVFRTIYMIPIALALSVTSIIWNIFLNPSQGIVNGLLSILGIPNQPFFTSPRQSLWSIILLTTWKGISFWMIFLIAGLRDIPSTIYEAAEIDGANFLQRTVFLSIPLLRRIILFVLVADTSVNFILFEPSYIITNGGPQGSTDFLMYEAFKSGLLFGYFGRSMAMVAILLVSALIIIGIQFRLLRSEQ